MQRQEAIIVAKSGKISSAIDRKTGKDLVFEDIKLRQEALIVAENGKILSATDNETGEDLEYEDIKVERSEISKTSSFPPPSVCGSGECIKWRRYKIDDTYVWYCVEWA